MINDDAIGNGPERQLLLKAALGGTGAAIGSRVVTSFPTIWAQNIKDVTIINIGGSWGAIKEIADQATKDLVQGRDADCR